MGIKARLVREFGKDHTAKETLLFAARILGLDASVYDGGPGSGNFGHKGRPGKRGGSTSEGGSGSAEGSKRADENVPVDAEGSATLHENESTFNQLRERQKAWHDKLEKEKTAVMASRQSDQALYAYEHGIAGYDEAVKAMQSGTADRLTQKYFDIMEANGSTESEKKVLKPKELRNQFHEALNGSGGDWTEARKDMIQKMTGQTDEQARNTLGQFTEWFGGSWNRADTDTLDRYIEQDGTCEGPIYRGMHFSEEEYAAFMAGLKPGSRINMQGQNSSWTTNEEVAYTFYRNGERKVKLKCLSNRTAAPVDHLSDKGEDEVLAHSRTEWTVLHVEEGSEYTEIVVVEAGEYMSDENWNKLKQTAKDAEPEKPAGESKQIPLAQRMQEQAKFCRVNPESIDFANEIERKYSK